MEEANDEVLVEEEGVPRGLVLRGLFGAAVITLVLCLLTVVLLRAREAQLRPDHRFVERALGAPGEVATVRADPYELPDPIDTTLDRQRSLLKSYGWVDEQRRVVRIPIERAIDLVLSGRRP